MEVKAGFKRTEVGPIPDQWHCLPLGNIIAPGTSITYGIVQAGPHVDDGIPYIKTGDMSGSRLPIEDLARTSKTIASRYPRSTVRVGELVYSIRASVGAVHCVPPELDGANLTQGTARVSPGTSVDAGYLLNALRSTACQNWITLHTKGTTYREITLATLRDLPVPLPPTKAEQEAIAEALSDADALIESLEQLLAKKRQLKQGAMQELLTGKKRLPAFGGEWEVKRLGEIGSTFGGLTGKTKHDFGHGAARYITFMNIMTNVVIDCGTFEFVVVKPTEAQNRVAKGDLFFNGSSETPEEVGMCAVLAQDVQEVFLNSFCFGFRFRDGALADGLYLAYFFRSREGRELLKSLAQGATRYNLSKTALLKVAFPLPQLSEQTAIAAILSDMDAEIAALEAKLAKARALKQGMMQELLTGRIRLV